MLRFIGAETVLAVDISAITGDFSNLNVTGILTAEHIDADVQNAKNLYNGAAKDVDNTGQTVSFPLLNNLNGIQVISGLGSHSGSSVTWAPWSIPHSELIIGSFSSPPIWHGAF